MKVLVYGYGWSGQSAFRLFRDLGITARVVDDGLDLDFTEDSRFITYEAMLKEEFALYLICTTADEAAEKMLQKLQKSGIKSAKIKRVQTYVYKEKMRYLLKDFFTNETIIQDLCNDSYALPVFSQKLLNLQQKYFLDKKEVVERRLKRKEKIEAKLEEKTMFSKIYATTLDKTTLGHIAYPGFNVGISHFKREDKDFYFVSKIDFEKVKNRPKEVKLIACFGNSALRTEYLPLEENITFYLQNKLGEKFIVLNFGVTGYTLYEQMMLYVALAYSLKPEIVLAFFAGTDWRVAPMGCETLLKEHSMNFSPWFYGNSYRKLTGSELPLWIDFGTNPAVVNPKITYADVNLAMKERLSQFSSMVGGGGDFSRLSSLSCRLRDFGVRKSA